MMDRAEKLGLGAAIGGHVMLLGAMALGLFMSTERLKKPEALSVSLVGEIADVSTAPDAMQEEPAPAADIEAEPVPQIMEVAEPVAKPVQKPLEREVTPSAKTAVKKVAVKQPTVKPPPAKTSKAPSKLGGLSKNFEDAINNAGKSPGAGKTVGTAAAKTGAEVRRSVTAALGPQIMKYVRSCSPNGLDVDKIATTVTLSLNRDGSLQSLSGIAQRGVNENNTPQAKPTEQCVVSSIRKAAPFSGLEAEYYDVWKSHRMTFQPN